MSYSKNPSGTQEDRVLGALVAASEGQLKGQYVGNDGWVSKLYFLRVLGLTQAGRAIWNLEHERKIDIEHSTFTDQYKFRSYRLRPPQQTLL